ncbi:hypothetical protein EDB92DRAFT_1817549 [Lactarius akahatsu]|uniref:Uncharacterized protein n=1 Tax=Lactarius akahatsu TaxID=416441 RepID=A0AAD4LC41_9AGAM|nr:hypothetical protein EDB92DRAFT_1817549 [Lactarius akahatsu]
MCQKALAFLLVSRIAASATSSWHKSSTGRHPGTSELITDGESALLYLSLYCTHAPSFPPSYHLWIGPAGSWGQRSVPPTQLPPPPPPPPPGLEQSQASVLGPGIAGPFVQGIETGLVFAQWFLVPEHSESSVLSAVVIFPLPGWGDYVHLIPSFPSDQTDQLVGKNITMKRVYAAHKHKTARLTIWKLYVLSLLYGINAQPLGPGERPTTIMSTLTVPTKAMYIFNREARGGDASCGDILAERGTAGTADVAV